MTYYFRALPAVFLTSFSFLALANYIDTDLETLSDLTVDSIFQENTNVCCREFATYVTGGDNVTGTVNDQSSVATCGLGSTPGAFTPADAIGDTDSQFLQSSDIPSVVDLGGIRKSVVVFDAIEMEPVPEEALERTVWGSNSSSIASFPDGWTLATLNTIWKRGWTDPPVCQPGPNSDDYAAQYTFVGSGFRYIALFANQSISLFDTPSHTSWSHLNDANPNLPGWQSDTEETDAVGAALCSPDAVHAEAGPDQEGSVGETICFSSRGSRATVGIASVGWDTDGNNTITVTGSEACVECDEVKSGTFVLFVTDQCGCADTAHVDFACVEGDHTRVDHVAVGGLVPLPPPPFPPPPTEIIPPPPPPPPPPVPMPVPVEPAVPNTCPVCVEQPCAAPSPAASIDEKDPGDKKETKGCSTNTGTEPLLWLTVLAAVRSRRRR